MFVEHCDELNLMQVFQQVGALPPLGAAPGGPFVTRLVESI